MQLQQAINDTVNASKLPFYKAIKAAEERVKLSELEYIEVLLKNTGDVPRMLFDAARSESYVVSVLSTLKSRYKEVYGEEFDEKNFQVLTLTLNAGATVAEQKVTIVTFADAKTVTKLEDFKGVYETYKPGDLIYATVNDKHGR